MTARRVLLLSSLCSLCLCGSSSAALDPELKSPYQLRIVLHFADHPDIKAAFQDRVAKELEDAVQGALGDLGDVKVVREHPKLREVLQSGLQAALDGWKDRSGIKTHFVLVRYNGFEYEIQARQHDGVTGQASLFTGQVVRTERTRDRDFVARTAALLVARDFGVIGTLAGPVDSQSQVKVTIKGGGLGAPLSPWVQKDEVFGVVGIPSDGKGEVVFPWLFLRVTTPPADGARDGVCVCRVYFRHPDQLQKAGMAGFRCVKLGTARGPVRLRLTQNNPQRAGPANEALTVYVRRNDFDGESGSRLRIETHSEGTVDTSLLKEGEAGVFDHLAFVSIYGGAAATPRVPKLPVPILSDQPLEVSVPVSADDDGLFRFERDKWTRGVADSYLVQQNLFKRLNEMAGNAEKRKEALTEAQAGLDRCREDHARLSADRKNLEREIQMLPVASRPNLSAWDDRLGKIEKAQIDLVNYIKTTKEIQAEEVDPERVKGLEDINRGRLLEKAYELGEAIALYESARKVKSLDTEELRGRIADLRKLWNTKDEKHAEARTFIYQRWPKLDTLGLKSEMEKAKQAFAECKRAGDKIGPQKMLEAMLAHRQRIEKELKELNPKLNVEDEPKTKVIEDVTTELAKLENDLEAYLKTLAK
jgi:hypothetical protein